MPTDGGSVRVEVRIAPEVWVQEVDRLRSGSPARIAAERERVRLERDGLPLAHVVRCDAAGADGTRLAGLFKVYVPISEESASKRPFGFVLSPGVENGHPHLTLVAFGERHPQLSTRSVYERAHKRLHGRFPSQERMQPAAVGRSPREGSRTGSQRHGLGRPQPQERGGLER